MNKTTTKKRDKINCTKTKIKQINKNLNFDLIFLLLLLPCQVFFYFVVVVVVVLNKKLIKF